MRPGDDAVSGWPVGASGRGRHGPGCCCPRRGGRARRGGVRAAIMALLAERPMHGYEMISEIHHRTGGAWAPSPGALYPALQMLADEGLVDSEPDGSRRRYTLTAAGSRAVREHEDGPPPWAAMAAPPVDPADAALREAAAQTDAALVQVIAAGSAAQKAHALEVMTAARRSLYRLLAEDD